MPTCSKLQSTIEDLKCSGQEGSYAFGYNGARDILFPVKGSFIHSSGNNGQ